MSSPLTRAELRAWLRVVGGMKSLLNALDRQLRDEAGMSHDDYQLLGALHRAKDGTTRMSTLAGEIGMSPSRLSHAIARMEKDGWVARSPSPSDRRGTEVTLTDQGRRVVEGATPGHFELIHRLVFEELGPDGAASTAEAMDRIARAARDQSPDDRV